MNLTNLKEIRPAENPIPFYKMNPGCQLQLAMHTLSLDLQGITSTDEIVCRCIEHSKKIHDAYGFLVYPALNEEYDCGELSVISTVCIMRILSASGHEVNPEVVFALKPKVEIHYDMSNRNFGIPNPGAISHILIYGNDDILSINKSIKIDSSDKELVTSIRIMASMIENCVKYMQLTEEDLDNLF